jgi:zinc D-Ala-D-Ala carboxypeptidase
VRRLNLLAAVVIAVAALLVPTQVAVAADWPLVKQGDSGYNVRTVQHLLTARGHSTDTDGIFGPDTLARVRAFQQANGLAVDGIVGPNTWSKLIMTVSSGDSGHAVRGAQRQLNKHGSGLEVDGQFGPATETATRNFQRQVGIAVDGVIGPNTWRELTGRAGGGGGGGGGTRAQIATRIRNNGGITLYNAHVSGNNHPGSTARQNIIDASNGNQALRSPWGHHGATRVHLDVDLLQGMLDMRTQYGYTFRVTAIVGGSHGANSRHYAGLAFDVDTINGRRVSSSHPAFRTFMNRCRTQGATEVLGPGNVGHSTHIHCAWPR